jgi:hypothetical protein
MRVDYQELKKKLTSKSAKQLKGLTKQARKAAKKQSRSVTLEMRGRLKI